MKIALDMNKPRKIAFGTLAAVAALAFWPQNDQPIAAPREPSAPAAPAPQPRTAIAQVETLPARDAMPQLARDPFAVEAPVTRAVKTAAAVPAAPANPYRFAGEMRVGDRTQRFLARGDDTFEAKAGDTLEDGYAVESVSASAIVLVHRPSGVKQTLAVGAPAWEDPARSRVVQAAQPAPAGVAGGDAPRPDMMRLDALSGSLPQGFFVDIGRAPSRQPGSS